MNAFEVDHGMPDSERYTVRVPGWPDVLRHLTPDGCHLEPDDVSDERLPRFKFWFVVNNATGDAVDFIGVRYRPKPG